jgi:hypothetical protein
MELMKEPLDVDFYIKSRPLTAAEKLEISEFIRNQKLQNAKSATAPKSKPVALRSTVRKKVLA